MILSLIFGGISSVRAEDSPVINRIFFTGNRTKERLLRRRLPFTEGDILNSSSLDAARVALYDMHQFKKVEISSGVASTGGADVFIRIEDGWYAIPFPYFGVGSGGHGGGMFLAVKNLFGESEFLTLYGASGQAGARGGLNVNWEGWSMGGSFERRDYTERQYADGAYSSATGLRDPADQNNPGRFGTVVDSYDKRALIANASIGVPILRRRDYAPKLGAEAGWQKELLSYSNPIPAMPGDAGRQGQIFVGLRYTVSMGGASGGGGGGMGDALGAIFGYGLADLDRRIKPLAQARLDSTARLTYYRGERWTGSDFSYSYELMRLDSTYTWGAHRSLNVRLAGGHGDGLPTNRLLATGGETGLQGSYAREFRGDSGTGASLAYSQPFRTTRRGVWQGTIFVEGARAWYNRQPKDKAGVGASFWYKFWRFPLPLGISYTYSLDDKDSQVSAALGGRF